MSRKGNDETDPVTTRNVMTIMLLICLLLLADRFWLHWDLPLFLGKRFVAFVEYLSFWR